MMTDEQFLSNALDEFHATRMLLAPKDPTAENAIAIATAALMVAKYCLECAGGRTLATAIFAKWASDLATDKPMPEDAKPD